MLLSACMHVACLKNVREEWKKLKKEMREKPIAKLSMIDGADCGGWGLVKLCSFEVEGQIKEG